MQASPGEPAVWHGTTILTVRKGGKEIEKWVTLPVLVQESGYRGEYVDGVLSLTLVKAGQGDKEIQIPIR